MPAFAQVALLGYPPFVKDVVDRAGAGRRGRASPSSSSSRARFSEEWRTLVGARTGSTRPCYDSASLYGTADAGVLGCETPLSVAIRRFLAATPEAAADLFGSHACRRSSSTTRRAASSRRATERCSSRPPWRPPSRYHIADEGGLVGFGEMLAFLRDRGFDPGRVGGGRGIRPLPFVYLGRSHFTVSYFGANVYPENIAVALEQPPVCDWVTGKFVLQSREDDDRNRYLALVVEPRTRHPCGRRRSGRSPRPSSPHCCA